MKIPPAKIVAFLQNQWFKNPEKIKRMYERHPEHRETYIAAALFMGCKTGKVLRKIFGEEICDEIVWDETSKEIGGYSGSAFPADLIHMESVILKWRPQIVLAFGKTAANAVFQVSSLMMARERPSLLKKKTSNYRWEMITGPHPAARQPDTIQRLKEMRSKLIREIEFGV